MKYEQIKEGLVYGDLESWFCPNFLSLNTNQRLVTKKMLSLLLFMLKTIDLHKMASFMEKGATDILDTEVSPNPDDDGKLGIRRNKKWEIMATVMKLLEDVNRIVKVESWSFAFYGCTIDVTLQQIEGYNLK